MNPFRIAVRFSMPTMLKPCPAEWMECAEVSTLVNKPANNRAEVLEPLSASS
jgi:putative SOS response-associated peptidase YedK